MARDKKVKPLSEADALAAIDYACTFNPLHLRRWVELIHQLNVRWWMNKKGKRIERNKGEQLMLIVSELTEALEGHRKNLMDDHLPQYKMEEVELADAIIRILDYAGGHNLDVQGAFFDKLKYNVSRPDHKLRNRNKKGGKKY